MPFLLLLASITRSHGSDNPFHPIQVKGHFARFSSHFSRAWCLSFPKRTDNCMWHTTRAQSNLQAIILQTLWSTPYQEVMQHTPKLSEKTGDVFRCPPAASMPPATQSPKRFRATWLQRLLLARHDCNQGKLIQALHRSSKSTSSSMLWSPNVAVHLMRMTCPTERTCCSLRLTNGSVIWEHINGMARYYWALLPSRD